MLLLILKLWLFVFSSLFAVNEPTFKEGKDALDRFLTEKTVYPYFSKQNCIEGTIYVSFQLNSKAEVINAQIDKGLGIDLDDEALRLIRLTSQKWDIPADYAYSNKLIIPVSFSLKNYGCEGKSAEQISKAIITYKTQEALENTVFTYYKNKNSGDLNTKNEEEIIQLKADLGFNDEFIEEIFKQAKKKLKQGDKEGACQDFKILKNIGSDIADTMIAENCK